MSASRVFDMNGDIVHAPGLRRAPFKDWLHGIYPDLSVYTSVQHQLSETSGHSDHDQKELHTSPLE